MLRKLGLVSPPLPSADHKLFCLANSKHTKMMSFLLMYLLNLVLLRLQAYQYLHIWKNLAISL